MVWRSEFWSAGDFVSKSPRYKERLSTVVIVSGTEIVLGSRYKQLQALEKAKRRSSSAEPSATSRAAGTASRNGAKAVGLGARFQFSLMEILSIGPKVIVRVEEGIVSAPGMFTVTVVVTMAVAVLNSSQLLSRQRKTGIDKHGPSERCCKVCGKDVRHFQLSSAELLGSLAVGLKREKKIILDT